MNYGFTHRGKVYTPNGTTGISAEDNLERNEAIEQAMLAAWREQPDRMLAYYHLGVNPTFTKGDVTSWLGSYLGEITSAHVYRHTFGGRMVSIKVTGSNGAKYYGRASYDHGTCIMLQRVKS